MTKHKKSRSSERAGLSSEGRGGGIDQRPCESSSGYSPYSVLQRLNSLHNPATFATKRRREVTILGTSKKSEEKIKEGAESGLGVLPCWREKKQFME